MDKRHIILIDHARRVLACDALYAAPVGYHVLIQEPNRTLEQNAAQFPILEAFSEQLPLPVNGKMVHLDKYDWKDVLTAIFKSEDVRLAMWFDGRVIMLGHRTKEFGKKEFSDWLEFLHATAADRGVDIERKP